MQFWLMYIAYIKAYHDLEHAIRSNDIDLFTYTLMEVIALFFMTNHVNYSRLISKFQLDLLNIDKRIPGFVTS